MKIVAVLQRIKSAWRLTWRLWIYDDRYNRVCYCHISIVGSSLSWTAHISRCSTIDTLLSPPPIWVIKRVEWMSWVCAAAPKKSLVTFGSDSCLLINLIFKMWQEFGPIFKLKVQWHSTRNLASYAKGGGRNLSGLSMYTLCITPFFPLEDCCQPVLTRMLFFFRTRRQFCHHKTFFLLVLGCRKSIIWLIRLIYSRWSYLNVSYSTRKLFKKKKIRMKDDERNQRWIASAWVTPASTCLYKMGDIGTSSSNVYSNSCYFKKSRCHQLFVHKFLYFFPS